MLLFPKLEIFLRTGNFFFSFRIFFFLIQREWDLVNKNKITINEIDYRLGIEKFLHQKNVE